MITAKERLVRAYGIDVLDFLEKNGLEVKYKHMHVPHQTNRYVKGTQQTICHVVSQESNIVFACVNKDVNGFEIVTNTNNRFVFTQWVSNQNYIEVQSK